MVLVGAMRAVNPLSLALSAAPLVAQADPVDPRLALLDRDASQARLWFWGFTTIYSVSAVAQTTLNYAIARFSAEQIEVVAYDLADNEIDRFVIPKAPPE